AVGVQPGDELVIARLFIHQVADREVHGGLRTEVSRMRSPEYRRAGAGCKRPAHRFPYMSQKSIVKDTVAKIEAETKRLEQQKASLKRKAEDTQGKSNRKGPKPDEDDPGVAGSVMVTT